MTRHLMKGMPSLPQLLQVSASRDGGTSGANAPRESTGSSLEELSAVPPDMLRRAA